MYRNAFLFSFVAGLVCTLNVHAAPQPGRVVAVIDGDTLKVVSLDGNGKESDKPATFGIRGVAAPALDQPFGKQALARLKKMVEGKTVIWNGPVLRAHKEGRSLHFRTEDGKSLAVQMLSEGLGRVVVSELVDKSAKPDAPKKVIPEVTAAIAAEREAREAKRGLWAEKDAELPREIRSTVGMKLVYISPGKFTMGSPESEASREMQETQHEVELTKGFYMGAYEVTVGQFKQFVADTKFQTDGERDGKGAYGINEAGKIEQMDAKFTWKSPGFAQTDEHPVVSISWSDAKAFCNWLSEKEKKTYRLPTEAEWEYACRAGTKTAYFYGDDPEGLATNGNGADATARAKYPGWSIGIKGKDGHIFTAPVGQFKPNAFGLYDMHGNVWEWCEDWYVPNSYSKEKQVDPTGPATGKAKVQRGGGWSSDSKRLRSAARVGRDPSAYRGCYLGFRVALVQATAETTKKSAEARTKPAGLRVMFNGNSWFNFVPGGVADLVKAAEIQGHKEVKAAKPNDFSLIESGDVDVYAHGVHWWTEPIRDAEKILVPGLKANPNFRVYYHAAWLVGDGRAKEIKTKADYDDSKLADVQAALDKTRKGVEATVDKLNEKFGKRVVFLVPIGDATLRLRALVLEGKYPGVKKQSELWNDAMPHAGVHVMALSGYCHFAAIYRTSPVGLKIARFKELTDEQHAILQKLAWDVVSKYPHAGVPN